MWCCPSSPPATQAKVRKRLAQLAPLLNLPSAVTITAEGLAARAAKLHIRGLTSGAGLAALVYAACRLEAQPVSIATVAGAAGSDSTRVGHSFLALSRVRRLGMGGPEDPLMLHCAE